MARNFMDFFGGGVNGFDGVRPPRPKRYSWFHGITNGTIMCRQAANTRFDFNTPLQIKLIDNSTNAVIATINAANLATGGTSIFAGLFYYDQSEGKLYAAGMNGTQSTATSVLLNKIDDLTGGINTIGSPQTISTPGNWGGTENGFSYFDGVNFVINQVGTGGFVQHKITKSSGALLSQNQITYTASGVPGYTYLTADQQASFWIDTAGADPLQCDLRLSAQGQIGFSKLNKVFPNFDPGMASAKKYIMLTDGDTTVACVGWNGVSHYDRVDFDRYVKALCRVQFGNISTTSGVITPLLGGTATELSAGTAYAGFRFNTNGTVDKRIGSIYTYSHNWFSPTTSNVGAGYFIKIGGTSGVAPSGGMTSGTYYAMTSAREFFISDDNGASDFACTVSIATTANDADIVTTGNYAAHVEGNVVVVPPGGIVNPLPEMIVETTVISGYIPPGEPLPHCQSGVRFNTNGSIDRRHNATYTALGLWFSPATTSIGSSYFIKITNLDGSLTSGLTPNTWYSLSTARLLSKQITGGSGAAIVEFDVSISTSASDAGIVTTGHVYLECDIEP